MPNGTTSIESVSKEAHTAVRAHLPPEEAATHSSSHPLFSQRAPDCPAGPRALYHRKRESAFQIQMALEQLGSRRGSFIGGLSGYGAVNVSSLPCEVFAVFFIPAYFMVSARYMIHPARKTLLFDGYVTGQALGQQRLLAGKLLGSQSYTQISD